MPSTPRSRLEASNTLLQLGRAVLLQRTSEMLAKGLATARESEGKIIFHAIDATLAYYLDRVDARRFHALISGLRTNDPAVQSESWTYRGVEAFEAHEQRPGRYFFIDREVLGAEALRADIDELMKPLIRPQDTGHGIMVSYRSTEEVHDHFLAVALGLADEWRQEAGIHPDATIAGVPATIISLVALMMISRHLAHVRYVQLAAQLHPNVSVPQSLTIWAPRARFEEELIGHVESEYGFDPAEVRAAIDAITLGAGDAQKQRNVVTPLVPQLVDIGGGVIVQPVSSIFRNPFLTIANLQEVCPSQSREPIRKPREAWMRSDLYASFLGNRYECVEHSTIASVNRIGITDIDAAVFDRMTGTLGLFELKWQDLHVSDIRQMSSRARNLADKLKEWVEKVNRWRAHLGDEQVARALRLRTKGTEVRAVYLFALSRTATRTGAFGYRTNARELAMANWFQFLRVRHDVGPSDDPIRDIHGVLIDEHETGSRITELPVTIEASGTRVVFENLWVGTPRE